MNFNPHIEKLKTYEAGKPIELVVREYGIDPARVVKLASNENPLGASPRALARLVETAQNASLYPDDSYYELKNALAAKHGVGAANVIIGSGSDQIIEFIIHAKCNAECGVLVAGTTFAMYEIYAAHIGAPVFKAASREHNLAEFGEILARVNGEFGGVRGGAGANSANNNVSASGANLNNESADGANSNLGGANGANGASKNANGENSNLNNVSAGDAGGANSNLDGANGATATTAPAPFTQIGGKSGAKIGVVFICAPNNPLGGCLDEREIMEFIAAVPPGVLVVIDAAYAEFARFKDPRKSARASAVAARDNAIFLGTFSKAYGLGGMRVGYGIACEPTIAALHKIRAPFNITTPSLAAAIAALSDGDFIARTLQNNAEQMAVYERFFAAHGLEFIESYANFITFFCAQRDGAALCQRLLERGVILRSLRSYGLNAVRITVGTPAQNERVLAELEREL